MSYQVKTDRAIARDLRRISRQQVEAAIKASRANDAGSPVHQTRKHLKKARAALEMMRPVVNKGEFKEAKTRLRSVAHLLSGLRDAEVRALTVQEMRHEAPRAIAPAFAEAETLLQFELESFRAAFDDWPKTAGRQLQSLRRRIRKCRVDSISEKRLRRMLQESYRDARNALRIAVRKGDSESLHEFRKRAKSLMYQARILEPLSPGVFAPLSKDLRSLTEQLGRAHDLAFVEQRLNTLQPGKKRRAARQIDAVIDRQSAELEETALQLAQRIFVDSPKAFARRVRFDRAREAQLELHLPSARPC